jgi:PhzF family phenazine biosynthesis protein
MEILRYTAFSSDPAGGNPAGVVLDASGVGAHEMLKVAAEVGYSETAFVVPRADGALDVRYFSPLAEVPFCGHATIATAVAYADRHGVGPLLLHTMAGTIPVATTAAADGTTVATLVSVAPRVADLPDGTLPELLAAFGWTTADLDPELPPRVAFGGAWHPVIAVRTRDLVARLAYDMRSLGELMARHDWTTVDVVWREAPAVFHARNPFPPGGVYEDPATGAAAAAFGGYLRELGLVEVPARITVHQGVDMRRPSVIEVAIPAEAGSGISVTGTAVPLR